MIKVQALREYLGEGKASVGGWMQIKSSEIAEILGSSGLDWVAVDLEHGSIGMTHLTNICRAIELHIHYLLYVYQKQIQYLLAEHLI